MQLSGWNGKVVVSGTPASGLPSLRELLRKASDTAESVPEAKRIDECFWLYSSGSTGKPKGAVHRQRSMASTAESFAQEILEMNAEDIVYSAAKLFFAYGLGNALSFPLSIGAKCVLYCLGRLTTQAARAGYISRPFFVACRPCSVPLLAFGRPAAFQGGNGASAMCFRRRGCRVRK